MNIAQRQEPLSPLLIIPVRLASQRLPNKALLDIAGKPMIQHVWEQSVSFNLGPVIVACSDQKIADLIESLGGTAILTDPNLPSGTDRIEEALKKYEDPDSYNFIVNVQGDLPLIQKSALTALIHAAEQTDADIVTLASSITTHEDLNNPNIVKIAMSETNEKNIYRAHYFSRSPIPYGQEIVDPKLHFHHIGLYGYKKDSLNQFVQLPPSPMEKSEKLEQLRALENNMSIAVSLFDEDIIGVDTEEDLELVRGILNGRP